MGYIHKTGSTCRHSLIIIICVLCGSLTCKILLIALQDYDQWKKIFRSKIPLNNTEDFCYKRKIYINLDTTTLLLCVLYFIIVNKIIA